MSKFKVGDKVRSTFYPTVGNEGRIVKPNENYNNCWLIEGFTKEGGVKHGKYQSYHENNLELITNNTITNMKEKFIQMFLSEPEKSFRKAEITNGDGLLTNDGQTVFLSWLLKKYGSEFKTDVVDGLLAEEKK